MTDFTLAQLAALTEAIATGALKVKYQDREVTYHSLADMIKLRDQMRQELGVAGAEQSRNRRYAQFGKGF